MNAELTLFIAEAIKARIEAGYKKGLKATVKKNKQSILGMAAKPKKTSPLFSVDFTADDVLAMKHFNIEAFHVAGVGSYRLEEKLKQLAADTKKNQKGFDYFESEARRLMLQYIPIEEQAPTGWLETNYNTALNSSYTAAQWNRINDPALKEIYPALMYMTREDDRVREEHAVLDKKVYYVNDPIWDIILPPNGWNCRCYTIPVDDTEIKDLEPEPMIRTEDDTKEIRDSVHPDFRRNAAESGSIWGKWLKQEFNDMPKDEVSKIKSAAKEFAK